MPGLLRPAVVAGFGFGAFLDGIVLHQILQWHHLVSEIEGAGSVSGLETNTFWDGIFHLSAWFVTLAGAVLLWRARSAERPFSHLIGPMLVGWGAFNVIDQLVFHLAIGAHHIRDVENYAVYDWSFFAFGVLLIAGGWLLARRRRDV